MAAAGVQPDAVSYNTALLACQRAGEWDSVLELFERVRRAGGKGAPNAFSFNAALAACAATSGVGGAAADSGGRLASRPRVAERARVEAAQGLGAKDLSAPCACVRPAVCVVLSVRVGVLKKKKKAAWARRHQQRR